MASQTLNVNIAYDDANSIAATGMNYSDTMSLNVGPLVESGTMDLAPGETIVLVHNAAAGMTVNTNGVFILIKNKSGGNKLEIETSITAAEASGGATYITAGRLGVGEFNWINLAGENESGSTYSRALRVKNNSSENIIFSFSIFSR